MVDDIDDIAQFYDNSPDAERERLEQHQLEYDLTWRYLQQYLPPAGDILEIGAATGRYTVELARRGHAVTAVDLSAELLAQARQRLAGAGQRSRVRLLQADARELSAVTEKDFAAVLLMGPLYHLIQLTDRELALRQALARLRPGGVIFSVFLSRLGILGDLLKGNPGWIEDEEHVGSFLENGRRPSSYPRGGFRAYYAWPSEIAPLHERLGVQTLAMAGVEPAIGPDDASYNRLQGRQRQLWLDLLFRVSQEASTVGASRHLLYVGQKGKG